MLVAPEMLLDRRAHALGGQAVALRERGLVPRRHRRRSDEPAVGRGRAVRVLPVRLLPEVDARQRKAGLVVHEAAEEVGRRARRGPELAVERGIAELAPRRLVGEHDHPGLVELVESPARRERAVRPVALEPQALRRLLAREPAQRGDGEVAAARREEAEDDVAEIARPDEAVAARLLEARVELGRRDGRARLAVRQLLEDEERARVQVADGVLALRLAARARSPRGRTPRARPRARRARPLAGRRRPCDRLVRRGPERDEDACLADDAARDEPVDRRAVDDDVVGGLAPVRLAQRRRRVRRDERDRERDVAEVEDERSGARIDVAGAAPVVAVEARCDRARRAARRGRANAADEHGLGGRHEVGHLDGRRRGDPPSCGARMPVVVRLRPRTRRLVEPVRLAVALEPEAELAEMLAVVDVRPEEPLDLSPPADRDEEGAVAEDRRRAERVAPSGVVERGRDVGLDRHQRSLVAITGTSRPSRRSLARRPRTRRPARAGSHAGRRRRRRALRRRCRRASTSSPVA